MKHAVKFLLIITVLFANFHCSSSKKIAFSQKELYKSDYLVIIQISENAFQHISFLQTNDFGNVPCNGLVVRNSGETIIFDTPANDKSSAELIAWVKDSLHCKINAVIPTHFHNDCLAGLKTFHENNIPSYANYQTIELAKKNNYMLPQNAFRDSLILKLGNETIMAKYFGEGHSKDNVVGYFPAEKVMFGGCLIKEMDATKGYLGDANLSAWSATVEKVKAAYPDVQIVVPGHGAYGNKKLLDYTIKLFAIK